MRSGYTFTVNRVYIIVGLYLKFSTKIIIIMKLFKLLKKLHYNPNKTTLFLCPLDTQLAPDVHAFYKGDVKINPASIGLDFIKYHIFLAVITKG